MTAKRGLRFIHRTLRDHNSVGSPLAVCEVTAVRNGFVYYRQVQHNRHFTALRIPIGDFWEIVGGTA